jgi:phosphatidylglycerophosphate synthase
MTDGERWARDALLALRDAGFRRAAWWRFLAASFARASQTRRARPALARQARAWSATALLAGHAARRLAHGRSLPTPSTATWTASWLAGAAMLDWHLGMLEGPAGEPHERLRPADALTMTRGWLAPFIAVSRDAGAFSVLVAAAGASDLLDGWLARRAGPTRLGRELDTIADVAVKLAAARAARRAGWLSPTTGRLLSGCQVAGVATAATAYFRTGQPPGDQAGRPARWIAPFLIGALALAPQAPRAADRIVRAASMAALAVAFRRHTTTTEERDTRSWVRQAQGSERLRANDCRHY